MFILALTAIGVESILSMAAAYGIFPVLFVILLIYVMKNNDKRETSVQNTLNKVNDTILSKVCTTEAVVVEVKQDIKELKVDVGELKEGNQQMEKKIDILTIKVETK